MSHAGAGATGGWDRMTSMPVAGTPPTVAAGPHGWGQTQACPGGWESSGSAPCRSWGCASSPASPVPGPCPTCPGSWLPAGVLLAGPWAAPWAGSGPLPGAPPAGSAPVPPPLCSPLPCSRWCTHSSASAVNVAGTERARAAARKATRRRVKGSTRWNRGREARRIMPSYRKHGACHLTPGSQLPICQPRLSRVSSPRFTPGHSPARMLK